MWTGLWRTREIGYPLEDESMSLVLITHGGFAIVALTSREGASPEDGGMLHSPQQ